MIRPCAAGLAAALVLALAPPATAVTPPSVDASVAPPPGSTGATVPMAQRGECAGSGLLPGTDVAAPPVGQSMLNVVGAWGFSRGEGQTVAVIDTGVHPGPRLPDVIAGGDYVADADGLSDCDGHGTMVAGIIAGQPGPDGFTGVAPAARILSIRQTSARFAPRSPGEDPALTRATADIGALARAVVRAADLGARVINISSVTCLPANNTVDQNALGAALRYAAVDKDAVIVAAAGNAGPLGVAGGAACQSNSAGSASGVVPRERGPATFDSGDWAGVTAVSVPAWWQPYVLSVGSVGADGQPSVFTMSGPWLGIAGPGENVLSLSNIDGGLANGLPNERGQLGPVSGTSFAAAYVSGVAALVRSRFPQLNATQVVERLTQTAHNGAKAPSNVVGAGTVDPVAALTWQLPGPTADPQAAQIAAPAPPVAGNNTPRIIAFAGTAVLALAVAAAAIAANRRKDAAE